MVPIRARRRSSRLIPGEHAWRLVDGNLKPCYSSREMTVNAMMIEV